LNDIGRNFLLGNRKKIAKCLMRTFTGRSTFLCVPGYGHFTVIVSEFCKTEFTINVPVVYMGRTQHFVAGPPLPMALDMDLPPSKSLSPSYI
jgi:hypothetical protein